jgi:DNA-binding LacI/PurR family transcriptional regulator
MIGRLAAEHLVGRINGNPPPERRVDVSFRLVARDST